ncbi:NRAMP family divalent metal transporter [Aeromicrobium terrae]|uniref:Divalent metal cation transporter n=1 Tax=Aeromicrobium terrae TaxID=2498846 RepID=A0A5C8NJD6_9ACTN|nr:divalent metal cation transporter [Aeromicrobium terrae]TXL60911.1 divalent metal cation transporter [Aeromicrobium terrae]
MKKYLAVALGILTAIGGFVDIGDLVTNAVVGARFGLSLAWVVVVGVIGIVLYAYMAGKVVALSGRATFEIIRERLGARAALMNLGASFLMTLLTLTAEIGGIALTLQLLTGIVPLAWIVVATLAVWLVIWLVKFTWMENAAGLLGLTLIVFVVSFFVLGPDWGDTVDQITQQYPHPGEHPLTYWFYVVALFGAAMTPYEVFFFSSGAVEERWGRQDLMLARLNVGIGFPLGGLLSLGIAGSAFLVWSPEKVDVSSLSQVVLPVGEALGTIGLALVLIGVLAATMGAALETALSCGYTLAQYAGWPWGKWHRPAKAPQFHVTIIVCLLIACGVLATGVDPIMVTEFSVVFSAVALPLTYAPILVVANDPEYVGEETNGPVLNALALVYLVIIVVAAVAAIPLMVLTGLGS